MSLFALPNAESLQEAHRGAEYAGSVKAIASSFIRATPRSDLNANIVFTARNTPLKVHVVGQCIERERGYFEGGLFYRVRYCRDLSTHIDNCAPQDQVYGWVRNEDLDMEDINWMAPFDIHNRYGVRLDPAEDLDTEEYLWYQRLKSSQAMLDELEEQKTAIAQQLEKFSQHFRDQFGLVVDVHSADGRRRFAAQRTPYDLKRFQAALDAMPLLKSWGINLRNETGSEWSPQEILYIHDAVRASVTATSKLAARNGLDFTDEAKPYKIVYGWDEGNQQTELARTRPELLLNAGYAVNNGGGKIRLSDFVFETGNRAYGLYGGGLGNSNLRFSSSVLIGHEISHNTNYQDDFYWNNVDRRGRLTIDGELRRLASFYKANWRDGTWRLRGDYSFTHMAEKIVTENLAENDRVVQLKTDSGFTHRASSADFDYERVTDAVNAQAQTLYTLGPYFNKMENLQGLARREQGELLVMAILDALG